MTFVRLSTMLAMAAAALALGGLSAASAFETPESNLSAAEDAELQAASQPAVAAEWAGPPYWAVLDWHPGADPSFGESPLRLSIPTGSETSATSWSRTENSDGSTAVSVKRSLTTGWDSKIGADMTLAPPPSPLSGPIDPKPVLPGAGADPSAGAAWATLTTPTGDAPPGLEGAALGARIDSSQTQHKLGVSASKSVTMGTLLSLTVQGGYAATDTSAPSTPVPVPPSGSAGGRIYSAEQVAKVAFLPTHTTIAAARTQSSADERWLHSVTAEQPLFEGVSVAGSVSESADGPPATSIVAKFQRRW